MDEPEPPDVPFALFYQGELGSPPEPETREDVQQVRTRMHEDAIRAHLMPEGPEGLLDIRGAARTKPPGPRRAWEPA